MEFPLTCGMHGCYKISPPLLCSHDITLICFSQLWNKRQKNGTPSPLSGPVFDMAR
jgi:hypothetical protein